MRLLPFNPFDTPEHSEFTLEGGQPAAVLVHGFPGTPAEMRPLAKALNGRGWTVRGLLLPGFGAGLDTLPERTAEEWAGAAKAAVKKLRIDHKPVMLVGNSMGASVIMRVANECKVDGITLLSPFWRFGSFAWGLLPVLARIMPRPAPFRLVRINYRDEGVRTVLQKFFPKLDPDNPESRRTLKDFRLPLGIFDQIRRAGLAAYRAATNVYAPLLAVQGSTDPIARIPMTKMLLRKYAGPIRYAEVEGEHDLLDPSRPAWDHVRTLVLRFAGQMEKAAALEEI